MPAQYATNLLIGDKFHVNDLSILYMNYRVVWDRGTSLELLIHDETMELHKDLDGMTGDPTPTIEFQYEWLPSQAKNYKNKGSKHKLYIIKAGLVTTEVGVCIRIKAVDKASVQMRSDLSPHHATSIKAGKFCEEICDLVGVDAKIPDTGDVAYRHTAKRAKAIDAVRYELDRVLSAAGKPISLQFDDRSDYQILKGYEELYENDTALLETLSGGAYNYGVPVAANQGVISSFGNTAYHFEMDQDFIPGIWGHVISVNHLTTDGNQVTGELKAKTDFKLGIQGQVLQTGGNRIQLPAGQPDNPTSDEYYAKAIMTNSLFQNEVATTSGVLQIDPDFKAFDDPSILNRKHITVAVTAGKNEKVLHSLVPTNTIVMGWQHMFNINSVFTKVLVRRGK